MLFLQWLAFRNDGKYSAADYCMRTSQKCSEENARGKFFWNPFNKEEKINQRRFFIIKLLNGAINGLAYLHNHDRLHQSLGPSSIVLKYITSLDFYLRTLVGIFIHDKKKEGDLIYVILTAPSWRRMWHIWCQGSVTCPLQLILGKLRIPSQVLL